MAHNEDSDLVDDDDDDDGQHVHPWQPSNPLILPLVLWMRQDHHIHEV
jgi:hypothetical protein